MKNSRRAIAALACAALAIAACGSGDDDDDTGASQDVPQSDHQAGSDEWLEELEAAAIEEGQLVIYASTAEVLNRAEIDAFQAKYPEIKVVHTRLVANELTARFASETQAGAPSADLIRMGDTVMMSQNPEWFVELTDEVIPNRANQMEGFEGTPNAMMTLVEPFFLHSNPDLVPDPPESWCDLADPKYADLGALPDPRNGGSWMTSYAMMGEECGEDFLPALREYEITASVTSSVQNVAAGDLGFTGPGIATLSKDLRDGGAPVELVNPTPSIGLWFAVSIAEAAENPNAARLYANWIMSREGLEAACPAGGGTVLNVIGEDVESCPPVPDTVLVADYAWGQSEDVSANVIEQMGLS